MKGGWFLFLRFHKTMYIRRYFTGAILLLTFIGWAVFTFVTQSLTPDLDIAFTDYYIPSMPAAIAVLIPAFILLVLTLGHMIFYALIEYFRNLNRNSDFEKLEEAIRMNLKGKIIDKPQYTSSLYKDIGELFNVSKIEISPDTNLDKSNKFHDLVKAISLIKKGEIIEINSSMGYYLKELNYWNALKQDPNIAEQILMERGFYSDELYIEAFAVLCKVNTYSTIERYMRWFSIKALFNILARIDDEENGLTLDQENIFDLIDSVKFTRKDYLKLAKVLQNSSINPDLRLDIFKHLLEKDFENALEGYLYTMLDLEMVSEVENYINEKIDVENQTLDNIKAYTILKKEHSEINLDLDFFIR